MPVSLSNSVSSKANQNHKKKVQILMKKTHFTENEINRLLDIHYQIMVTNLLFQFMKSFHFYQKSQSLNAKLDRKKFRQFLHENFKISDDVIMDRIFKYFNKNSTDDIDHEEWVVGFNIFLKGTSKPCMLLITLTN